MENVFHRDEFHLLLKSVHTQMSRKLCHLGKIALVAPFRISTSRTHFYFPFSLDYGVTYGTFGVRPDRRATEFQLPGRHQPKYVESAVTLKLAWHLLNSATCRVIGIKWVGILGNNRSDDQLNWFLITFLRVKSNTFLFCVWCNFGRSTKKGIKGRQCIHLCAQLVNR